MLTGPYDVTVLPMGGGSFPGSMSFWGRDHLVRHDLQFHAVLIRGAGRVILINTGFAADTAALRVVYAEALGTDLVVGPEHDIHRALAREGLSAQEVSDLVLTPLGPYSSARLHEFGQADIWLAREGWVSFHTAHGHPHDARGTTLTPQGLAHLGGPGWDRLHLVEEDEVSPGLRLWWAGGHHRATLVVEVDTDGPTIVISDVFFSERNLTEHHPIGMAEDIYEVLDAYRRIAAVKGVAVSLMDPLLSERFPGGRVCRGSAE